MDMVPQDQGDRHGLSHLDRVHIKGVAAHGYHGVLAAERAHGQEFVVDVTLFLDTAQAAATDDLGLTVNYAHVCDALVSVVEGHAVNLIETLAERLAAIVLENQLVSGVAISVHKPRAPIAVPFTDVEVSIVRSRNRMPSVQRPFNEDQIAPVPSLPRWSKELPAAFSGTGAGETHTPREIPELDEVWAEQSVASETVLEDQSVSNDQPVSDDQTVWEQQSVVEQNWGAEEQPDSEEQLASGDRYTPEDQPAFEDQQSAIEEQAVPADEFEPDAALAPNVALAAPIIVSTELPAGVPTWAQVISTAGNTPDAASPLSAGPIFSPVSDLSFEETPEPDFIDEPEEASETEPEPELELEPELEPAAQVAADLESELLQEVPFEAELEFSLEPGPDSEAHLEPDHELDSEVHLGDEPEIEREVEREVEPEETAVDSSVWDFDAQSDYSDTVGNNDQTQIIPVITDDYPVPESDRGVAPIIEPSPESLAIYQALRAQVLGTAEPSESSNLAVPARAQPEGDIMDRVPLAPARVVIALGANLGTAQETLAAGVRALGELDGFELVKTGPLARTGSVGGPEDQPDYLNTVIVGLTTLSPRQLLAQTQKIENDHGRVRLEHWGPRTLDVDIIDFEGVVATTSDLELPHPRANQRAFVLVPWEVMDPDAYLPGLGGGPVAALAATAPDRPGIRWVALEWLES